MAPRQARARLADRVGEDRRAAVREIVAIDRGDDDVIEIEGADRAGDALGLRAIRRGGPSVRDRAVRAGARADVAENHEGRRAVIPALADVRALRFLADRVQLEAAHQPLQPQIARRSRRADLQPLRLRLPRLFGCELDDAGHVIDYAIQAGVFQRPVEGGES